jgi:FtsP/CotA-like multicopper oxidase with cupredoxin domain
MKRLPFLTSLAAAGASLGSPTVAASNRSVSLEIRKVAWSVRPGLTVNVAAYNGIVPGPLLRVTEGDHLSVNVQNRTTDLQSVHWHGLVASDRVDGVIELGSPAVPVNGSRRYEFTATPGGTRWYHAHRGDGLFSGMFAPLIVDRKHERGNYDREVVLVLHEFGERIETLPPMAAKWKSARIGREGTSELTMLL